MVYGDFYHYQMLPSETVLDVPIVTY